MSTGSESILVLGATSSGKSSYVGQLVLRTEGTAPGRLRATRGLESYAAVEPVLKRLQIGLAPTHTKHGTYAESTLVLADRDTGEDVRIVWPEFAGEQVEALAQDRVVSAEWAARVRGSDAWLLFIRPTQMFLPEDALSRRIAPVPAEGKPAEAEESPLSGQARVIELLQLLTFVRGLGSVQPLRKPVLAIVLSCYDEVDAETGVPPSEVLRVRLPLVHDFITSTWDAGSLLVLGVAALGRALDPETPDMEFLMDGPESQGYLVLPDGEREADLTLAVGLVLDRFRGR